MQLVGVDWKGQRVIAALWTRAGTIALVLLYLIAAAADPAFWRPLRRRMATAKASAETGR